MSYRSVRNYLTTTKGNTHRFEYDRLDRMVKETRPLGQAISYTYDANGNLTQVTDPKGQLKKYSYDAANRRTKEQHYASTATAGTPIKTISYTYNTLDRLTGYASTSSAQAADNTSASYTYDTKQLRQVGETVTYATNGAPFTLASSTAYNALGQKSSHTYPDGATYSYSYDPLANRVTGSNASTGSAQGPSNYSYNANNQLTQAGSISYSYDANGNTTSWNRTTALGLLENTDDLTVCKTG